jgi:rhamnose utilization protein RhaD (predicted bifunctional aldolase and dehydrogenase)
MNPEAALADLVALSRELGRPERDLVVLAEGNTSVALGDGTFLVKASGERMDGIGGGGFVRLALAPLLELVEDGARGDGDVAAAFAAARVEPSPGAGAPSIETLLHVLALVETGVTWVGHTHPTPVTGLLCSVRAEEVLAGRLFPDEVVVCGPVSLFVPYADPGLALARTVLPRLRRYVVEHGRAPAAILLANHGLVALGRSAAEVEAITQMTVKAARVRAAALPAGGPAALDQRSVLRLDGRPDERERAVRLFGVDEVRA